MAWLKSQTTIENQYRLIQESRILSPDHAFQQGLLQHTSILKIATAKGRFFYRRDV